MNAECGANRKCFPAGLCGLGDHGDDYYAGVCGGLQGDELDCDEVTTKCTSIGSKSECAHGAECFPSDKCYGDHYVDDTNGDDLGDDIGNNNGDDVDNNYLPPTNFDDDSQDDNGVQGEHHPNDICFSKGNVIHCTDGTKGDPIIVEFFYNAETSGVDPETIVSPLEREILSSVSDYVSASAESYGVTRISSSPEDYIKGEQNRSLPLHILKSCIKFQL
jgi:hypothetical protein